MAFVQIGLINDDRVFTLVVFITGTLVLLTLVLAIVAVLLRARNDYRKKRRRHLDALWLPQTLAVLNGELAPAEFQKRIPFRDRMAFLDFLYLFARQLRGEKLEVVRELAHPFLKDIDRPLRKDSAEARARRIQIIGLLGFDAHSEQVIQSLDDASPLVAMVAARTLIRREHPEYVDAVLERLHRFKSWSDDLLSSMLAGLGVGVSSSLNRIFADEEQPAWVRQVVAKALGELHAVEAVPAAVEILERETDRGLILAAVQLLEQVGGPEHIPVLLRWQDTSYAEIRAHVIDALAQIGGEAETEHLITALNDESRWVALAAARGLKEINAKDTLRTLAASGHPRAELVQQVLFES